MNARPGNKVHCQRLRTEWRETYDSLETARRERASGRGRFWLHLRLERGFNSHRSVDESLVNVSAGLCSLPDTQSFRPRPGGERVVAISYHQGYGRDDHARGEEEHVKEVVRW